MDAKTYQLHLRAGKRYGREATCGTKVNFKSESTANRAAQSMAAKADKPLEAYPCAWCEGWHIGRKMSEQELREAGAAMKLFGESDPSGGDGYVPGAWDEVREAYLDGHISEEAYEVLHRVINTLKQEPDL
jgi:hypothetical protein